jgi:hypothetical protein
MTAVAAAAVVVAFAGLSGCKKKTGAESAEQSAQATNTRLTAAAAQSGPPPPFQLHWIGKKRIATDTNAVNLMAIWSAPESKRLEERVLEKLALAPSHVFSTNAEESFATNARAKLLMPLLRNALEEEVYFATTWQTNELRDVAAAIRLSPQQAGVWRTNLESALRDPGWAISSSNGSGGMQFEARLATTNLATGMDLIELGRAGEWTIAGIGGTNLTSLMAQVTTAAQHAQQQGQKPHWLEISAEAADMPFFAKAFDAVSNRLAALTVTMAGEAKNVRIEARMHFERPLELNLTPWNIPTNLVADPLIGFTAARGIGDWLGKTAFWKRFGSGDAPNDVYAWSQRGMPAWHFLASPSAQASNTVAKLTEFVTNQVDRILETNRPKYGTFVPLMNGSGVSWRGMPWFSPTVRQEESDGKSYAFIGFSPVRTTNKPAPEALWAAISGPTNLVYYDWQLTGACVDGLSQVFQMSRLVFGMARLTQSAGLECLHAMEPKLGNAATEVRLTGPADLTLQRSSTVGFTALELEFIADWVESPTFPRGLHTFVAPRPPSPARHPQPMARTNGAGNKAGAGTNAGPRATAGR